MKVCDRCRQDGVETITYKGKQYELCKKCSGKIEKFLSEKERQPRLLGMFNTG